MKKSVYLFLAALLCSCAGNKTEEVAGSADSAAVEVATDTTACLVVESAEEKMPSIEEVITEQIETNYNAALKANNEASSIKKYCSVAFISTYNNYQKAVEGAIGDIDYDLWLQAQDFSNPSAQVDNVTMADDNKAEVSINIKNFGTNTKITLIVIKEGDSWKIDDFVNNGQKVTKVMKENIIAFSE